MRMILIGGATAALVAAIAPALAQPAPPRPAGVAQGTAPLPQRHSAHVPPVIHSPAMVMINRGVMTRDALLRHVRSMFARLDTNHDGFITRDELGAARARMMRPAQMGERVRERRFEGRARAVASRDRNAMFNRLDANHDGVISRQEFMAARPRIEERRTVVVREGASGLPPIGDKPGASFRMHRMAMRGGFAAHMFAMADTNHDGRVSLAEAEAAAIAHFDRVDLNHDGRITPDERRQAHARMQGEHHPR